MSKEIAAKEARQAALGEVQRVGRKLTPTPVTVLLESGRCNYVEQ